MHYFFVPINRGGIKKDNKTKVDLTIQNFELNNLTLGFKINLNKPLN